jgi:hypothetical protein
MNEKNSAGCGRIAIYGGNVNLQQDCHNYDTHSQNYYCCTFYYFLFKLQFLFIK